MINKSSHVSLSHRTTTLRISITYSEVYYYHFSLTSSVCRSAIPVAYHHSSTRSQGLVQGPFALCKELWIKAEQHNTIWFSTQDTCWYKTYFLIYCQLFTYYVFFLLRTYFVYSGYHRMTHSVMRGNWMMSYIYTVHATRLVKNNCLVTFFLYFWWVDDD